MSTLDKLASAIGRNDEQPNIALAEAIAKRRDARAVAELVAVLEGKTKAVRSDAIKVLYEIGERKPELIAGHLNAFIGQLESRDNRMVWGAMCAVDAISSVRPKEVFAALPRLMIAVDKGSVITRDHAVKAMTKLAGNSSYAAKVLPLLQEQLRTCPVNQLPMYAELVATVINGASAKTVMSILEGRLVNVPQPAKRKRIEKVLKRLTRA